MEKSLLFINRCDEENRPDSESELMQRAINADKKTLLEIIEALMDSNDTLRKYIDLIEKEYKIR